MGIEALAIGSLVTGVLGAGVSAFGQMQAGQARAAEASYQAQVARNNEIIAGRNATYAIQSGEAAAERQGLQNRETLGRIVTAEAANGVDVNSGSNVDVRSSEREVGMENVDATRHKALMQAYGYNVQGLGFESQARLNDAAAANATATLPLTIGSSLLQSASALGTKYTQFNQQGAFGS